MTTPGSGSLAAGAGASEGAPSLVSTQPGERFSVLHVAPIGLGGISSVVRAVALGQRRRGYAVAVMAVLGPDPVGPHVVSDLREQGVAVFEHRQEPPGLLWNPHDSTRIFRAPYGLLRRFRSSAVALEQLAARIQPDVVHQHGGWEGLAAVTAARKAGIPVVGTIHGLPHERSPWRERAYMHVALRALRRCTAKTVVCRQQRDRLGERGVPPADLHVIHNAWSGDRDFLTREEARRLLGLPQDTYLVGWVGRLSVEKAADTLLEAAGSLSDVPLAVALVGTRPAGNEAETPPPTGCGNGRVAWCGSVPHARRFYRAFDAFVLSSRAEGTPMVIFEAMAAGVPVIATAVGGVPELLSSADAVLVPPDSPAALAGAIRSLWHDPEAGRRRAVRARRRLDADLGLDAWLDKYASVYRTACSAPIAQLPPLTFLSAGYRSDAHGP